MSETHHDLSLKPNRRNCGTLDRLPETGFVRQRQLVNGILPFSNSTLWRMIRSGTFPRPVKLSARISAWSVADIRSWMERKEAERHG